ncbi:MAG TPA: M48 family metallopeptidase, partial [Planctomycetota bacterium]|nr:M48 family metallopeptidase [Planctomycetota bacterium]
MDFFAHQERARRNTGRLVVLFVLAVLGIVASVYAAAIVAGLMAGILEVPTGRQPDPLAVWWNPALLAGVVLCVFAVVGLGSAHKLAQVSAGGRTVAEMLGGRIVEPGARDPLERRLLNVVEEMAVASGVPVPGVYLLDEEAGINAFAAGFAPGDAVIGMTRGALEKLSRDELQGVVAHEFSHVLNGDMRLNLRLLGVVAGITVLGTLGWIVLRSTARVGTGRKKGGGVAAVIAFAAALAVIGFVGSLFGSLIKAAVSRQREFLADASAVQFTRNPGGIAGALRKIGGFPSGSQVADSHAPEIAHMLFGEHGRRSLAQLTATHPPLAERIRRIDPSFAGKLERRAEPSDAEVDAARG